MNNDDSADPARPETIRRLLIDQGPVTEAELRTALDRANVALLDDDELSWVLDEELDSAMPVGERWVWLPAVLQDRVFTHRLTDVEIRHDLLDLTGDLEPFGWLLDDEAYRRLDDGSPAVPVLAPHDADLLAEREIPHSAVPDDGALLLPPGRLRALQVQPGDLVSVRMSAGGLVVAAVAEPDVLTAVPAGLHGSLERFFGGDDAGPEMVAAVACDACAEDSEAFRRPTTPLTQLFDEAGFPHYREWVGPAGYDFIQASVTTRTETIARRYDLTEDEALAVLTVNTLYDRIHVVYTAAQSTLAGDESVVTDLMSAAAESVTVTDSDGSEPERRLVRSILPLLAEPAVAEAVYLELCHDAEGAPVIGLFAESLEPQAPTAARPALRWLRAKAHERLGDLQAAEETYLAAETLAPDWPPTLIDLARIANERGDASRGLSLLRRAGATPEHALAELLTRFQSVPRPDLGRNQPCWCGSGRKYKHCHLNNEIQPLEARAAWLYEKAAYFLREPRWVREILDVAEERARYAEDEYDVIETLEDPLVVDSVLFESGAFAEFLEMRGSLLPADEHLLARQWLLVPRSLYEVEKVERGAGLTLRDIRSGDVTEVQERTASLQLRKGDLICTHVLPTPDVYQIFGGIEPVALHQRTDLLALLDSEPDAVELCAFLSARFAPPVLQNTEGDPLVLCEATLSVPDPKNLVSTMDREYEAVEGERDHWIENTASAGMQRVRATMQLSGTQLHIQANSEARLDRVLSTIRRHVSGVDILSESRKPASDIQRAQRNSPPGKDIRPLAPTETGVAAAMAKMMRDFEQKWLDEPIPALDGKTPREAAADPTRRPDLIRLLNSFPGGDSADQMSARRLRALLGLTEA